MKRTLHRHYAWDMDGIVEHSVKWVVNTESSIFNQHIRHCLRTQLQDPYNPIPAYLPQAYTESLSKRNRGPVLFIEPSISSIVNGPLGRFHDNISVEIGFKEKDGTKDFQKRTYNSDLLGFIDAGYTSHTSDAGKARRLTSYTRIRVASSNPLWPLKEISDSNVLEEDWTIHCMGSTVCVSHEDILRIVSSLDDGLRQLLLDSI